MNIDIKKLSPELLNDFLYYFDNVAFANHKDWSGCYCVYPYVCEFAGEELPKGINSKYRDCAVDLIKSGKLQGYLAYYEKEVVGWCNANDKTNYVNIAVNINPSVDIDKKIKSIVCFTVAPNMQRKGIATKLLKKVYSDALEENYDIAEAYPYNGDLDFEYAGFHHTGTAAMYEKHGFSVFYKSKEALIMRKYLSVAQL